MREKSVDFKSSTAAEGDIEWEETKSDAKNGFAPKICIDMVMQFFSQM